MDSNYIDKSRLPSRYVTEGPGRAPHRSYLYAMGLTTEQMHQPLVGVATARNEAALITDGRFSGATRGFCVGHFGPEAAVGGPIAHIKDGDIISIDADAGTIEVNVSEEEFERRRSAWAPREAQFGSGAIWKYAQLVGPARYGALTNPGARGEKECYADI
jgi:dihydroxyacid dehydratase/phosphogluconate dehydratase